MTVLTCEEGIKVLSVSEGRALGAVRHWVKPYVAVAYKAFTQLYKSSLCPSFWMWCRESGLLPANKMQSRIGLCAGFRVYNNLQYVMIRDKGAHRALGRASLIYVPAAPRDLGEVRNNILYNYSSYCPAHRHRTYCCFPCPVHAERSSLPCSCATQALQVFESHAGILGPVEFKEFSLPYLRDIARRVKDKLKEAGQDVPMVSGAHQHHIGSV